MSRILSFGTIDKDILKKYENPKIDTIDQLTEIFLNKNLKIYNGIIVKNCDSLKDINKLLLLLKTNGSIFLESNKLYKLLQEEANIINTYSVQYFKNYIEIIKKFQAAYTFKFSSDPNNLFINYPENGKNPENYIYKTISPIYLDRNVHTNIILKIPENVSINVKDSFIITPEKSYIIINNINTTLFNATLCKGLNIDPYTGQYEFLLQNLPVKQDQITKSPFKQDQVKKDPVKEAQVVKEDKKVSFTSDPSSNKNLLKRIFSLSDDEIKEFYNITIENYNNNNSYFWDSLYKLYKKMYVQHRMSNSDDPNQWGLNVVENPITILNKRYKNILPFFKKNGYILDFGSGNGYGISILAEKTDNKLMFCDIKNTLKSGLNYPFTLIKINVPLPFPENTFDYITCMQVLHHVVDLDLRLKDFYRVLKPGGKLFIREHDINNENIKDLVIQEHLYYETLHKSMMKDLMSLVDFIKYSTIDFKPLENIFSRYSLDQKLNNIGFKKIYHNNFQTITAIYVSVYEK
jgi:ubiquinone/menaquinone biosynthesis C-methylase UbiE